MDKAVIFGDTADCDRVRLITQEYNVIYATDNDESKYGKTMIASNDIIIKDKLEILKGGFDWVVIASITGLDEIRDELENDLGVSSERIVSRYVDFPLQVRAQFLSSLAKTVVQRGIEGSVCEVGVFRGEFAKLINRAFPDRRCYLFDTFSGFDSRDVSKETCFEYSDARIGHLCKTSVELVLSKMPFPDMCIVKKGFFPETFDIPDEQFCFVNLDVDLYEPIAAGLNIFYPSMKQGGVILIHDYFSTKYKGVKAAVDEFCVVNNVVAMPIGDGISIAIIKS